MPELHGLLPHLSNLLDQGIKLALVTDGRMSGASGRVPVALHLTPEALSNETFSLLKDGDRILFDIESGKLALAADAISQMSERILNHPDLGDFTQGFGRGLFRLARDGVTSAEEGARTW